MFEPGDFVWIHFRKERFQRQRNNKLDPRGDGPFKVLQRLNDNSYIIDIPDGFGGTSATFNVKDLKLYDYEEPDLQDPDSRSNPFQQGGTDVSSRANQGSDPLVQINRPMTRAQTRRMHLNFSNMVLETLERENSQTLSLIPYNVIHNCHLGFLKIDF